MYAITQITLETSCQISVMNSFVILVPVMKSVFHKCDTLGVNRWNSNSFQKNTLTFQSKKMSGILSKGCNK